MLELDLKVGESVMVGPKSAAALGCGHLPDQNVQLQAEGHDYLAFRDIEGRARVIAFESYAEKLKFIRGINQ